MPPPFSKIICGRAKKTERGRLTSSIYIYKYTYMIQNLFQQTRQLLDTVAQVFHPIGSGSIFFRPPRKLVDLDLRGNYFQPADIYLVFAF